jgi:hypothetical protein
MTLPGILAIAAYLSIVLCFAAFGCQRFKACAGFGMLSALLVAVMSL